MTTRMMLTGRIGINKELVTEELPLLNIHVKTIGDFSSVMTESEEVESSLEGVNSADLEEMDTFSDQEEFYFCTQPKEVTNYYATEPKDGDMWYPELEHNEPEVTEYPLEEEYEDELHRMLLTKGDTETMKNG